MKIEKLNKLYRMVNYWKDKCLITLAHVSFFNPLLSKLHGINYLKMLYPISIQSLIVILIFNHLICSLDSWNDNFVLIKKKQKQICNERIIIRNKWICILAGEQIHLFEWAITRWTSCSQSSNIIQIIIIVFVFVITIIIGTNHF